MAEPRMGWAAARRRRAAARKPSTVITPSGVPCVYSCRVIRQVEPCTGDTGSILAAAEAEARLEAKYGAPSAGTLSNPYLLAAGTGKPLPTPSVFPFPHAIHRDSTLCCPCWPIFSTHLQVNEESPAWVALQCVWGGVFPCWCRCVRSAGVNVASAAVAAAPSTQPSASASAGGGAKPSRGSAGLGYALASCPLITTKRAVLRVRYISHSPLM